MYVCKYLKLVTMYIYIYALYIYLFIYMHTPYIPSNIPRLSHLDLPFLRRPRWSQPRGVACKACTVSLLSWSWQANCWLCV